MKARIVPMVHVPDIDQTAAWYAAIGFEVVRTLADDGETNWALLRLGQSELMLSLGGKPSNAPRREFDLYIHVENVEAIASVVKGRAEVVEEVHDTFYGQRELIIRDCNGFWITFGQPF